jgi:glycosyltransferase involved in cell wall biosynthesis
MSDNVSLGIAVCAYNRAASVAELLTSLKKFTTREFHLVICEDGGSDDTVRMFSALGIPVVTGRNRGVAWNKNRGLYWLTEQTDSTHILVIEDDMIATKKGWEANWIAALDKWSHINWANAEYLVQYPDRAVTGSGSVEDPFAANVITGCLMGFTRDAIKTVGYFDPRFTGYGYEHLDFSRRLKKSNMGVIEATDEAGSTFIKYLSIDGGMTMKHLPSPADKSRASANKEIFEAQKSALLYRKPWVDAEQRATLMTEISVARAYSLR